MRKKYDILVESSLAIELGLMIVDSTDSMIFAMHIAAEQMNSFDTVKCQIRVNHTIGNADCWRTVDLTPMLKSR